MDLGEIKVACTLTRNQLTLIGTSVHLLSHAVNQSAKHVEVGEFDIWTVEGFKEDQVTCFRALPAEFC